MAILKVESGEFVYLATKLSDCGMNGSVIKLSHTSANAENLVKISPVDSKITCLRVGPLKNKEKKTET